MRILVAICVCYCRVTELSSSQDFCGEPQFGSLNFVDLSEASISFLLYVLFCLFTIYVLKDQRDCFDLIFTASH